MNKLYVNVYAGSKPRRHNCRTLIAKPVTTKGPEASAMQPPWPWPCP